MQERGSESPEMVIQVMRYNLDYHDAVAIDPLTAILSLTEEDKNDPRIESAVEINDRGDYYYGYRN